MRLDNGKTVAVDSEKARHIDYGYAAESAKYTVAGRVILSGEVAQLAQWQADLANLNPQIRELSVYTSDYQPALDKGIEQRLAALFKVGRKTLYRALVALYAGSRYGPLFESERQK